MKISDIVNKLKKNITDNEGAFQQGRFVPIQAAPMMRQVVNAYNNSPIPFTPRIQQGGINVPKAIMQPIIKTAQPIINYLDPRGYQAERMNPSLGPQKLTSAIKAMPMTAANIYGASRLTPVTTALSGALGGVFSKATGGNFRQGFESGLGAAPSLSAIGSFSNPIINKTVGMAASRFTAPVSNFIANRAVTGLANIPEGYVMGKALGRKNYRPQDAALDFAFGATFGSRISGKSAIKVKGFTTKGMHPEDVRELTTILAKSKGMKSSLDTQMKFGKTIDTLAERYLDNPKNLRKMSFGQKLEALNERRAYDFDNRGMSMGLVERKNSVPQRTDLQRNFSDAISQPSPNKVPFGRLSEGKFNQINELLVRNGKKPLPSPELFVYPNVLKKLQGKLNKNLSPDTVADIAYSAIHGDSHVISSKYPQIAKLVKAKERGRLNTAFVGEYEGVGSIKSVFPDEARKNPLEGSRTLPSSSLTSETQIAPQTAQISAAQGINPSIPLSKAELRALYSEIKSEFATSHVNDTMRGPVAKSNIDVPIHNRNGRMNMNPDQASIDLGRGISGTTPIGNQKGSSQIPSQSPSQTQSQIPFSKQSSLRESIAQDTRGILTGDQVKQRGFTTTLKFSDKTPKQLRDMVSGTYVVKSNTQLKKDAQQLIRDNPNIAEQVALNPKTDTHVQIGNELIAHYGSTGNFTKAKQIADGMAESGTELGRAVHAFSQYDKTTPSGALKFAQSKVKEYNKSHPNRKLNINDDQVKNIFDRAHKIQDMPEGRERNIASNDLINEVNNLIPSTIVDKFVTVWKAGLLTSLRTHERNLLGNTIHGAAEVIKDIPASIADRVMALRTGSRSMVLTTQGSAQGARKGLTAAKDLITKGYDPDEAINKFDIRHVTWGNNKVEQGLKRYTDTVFRTLGATDKVYWNSSFARSLYNQAKTAAVNAGKSSDDVYIKDLFDNPTDAMLQVAKNDANISTFKNENLLSKVIVNAKNVLSKNEFTKFVSELVAPFTGVPSAIAGQFIAYSPIGLIKGATNAGRVVAGNVPDLQRQAAHEIGRGVMGTGLFGIGAYLSSIGLMTGQPKDIEESKQWEIEGKQANSVFIDGKWRSIGSVGPELLIVLAGAKAQEELSDPEGSIGQYSGNLGKDFLGQTFLQGVQQPLAAINDPNRYGENYIGGQVSSIIPNIIKDTSKALDKTKRENNDISDYMTNSIPGFRNTGIEKRDNLGNVLKQEPTGVGAYVDLFNSKTPIKTPISNELMRLHEAGYSATPSKLKKDQTINGKKMVLTPSQLNTLEAAIQPELETNLNALIQHPTYPTLSDADKKDKFDKVVQDTRKAVKKDINLNKVDDFTFEQYDEAPKNTSDKLRLFARGMTIDPKNSIKALITDEEMRKITGDAMILKRRNDLNMTNNKSDARNHSIPLSLGGDNSEMNLKYMSKADHAARTPYETELFNKLSSGEIKRKEAQRLIRDWDGSTVKKTQIPNVTEKAIDSDTKEDKKNKDTTTTTSVKKDERQAALLKEIKGTKTTESNYTDIDGISVSTREKDNFPFPDFNTSAPGQTLRADLNIQNSSGSKKNADIVMHLQSPDGKIISVPQTKETYESSGKDEYYGLELKIPQNATTGDWKVWASVNGKKVQGTEKLHKVVNAQAIDRYTKNRDSNSVTLNQDKKYTTNTTKSNSDVDSLIKKHFPQSEWDTARAVMMAESGGNPGAKGDDYPINGLHAPSYGLFQIRHLEGRPGPDVLLNAEENIKYAAQMQRTQGWGPWTGYTSGNYKQYLGGKGTFSGELANNESRALTQKQNDIEELYKNGSLTSAEATSAWEKLQVQKDSLKASTSKGKGKGKGKKLAIKKVTVKKVSVRAPAVKRFNTKIKMPKVAMRKMNTRVSQPKKLNIRAMIRKVSKTA